MNIKSFYQRVVALTALLVLTTACPFGDNPPATDTTAAAPVVCPTVAATATATALAEDGAPVAVDASGCPVAAPILQPNAATTAAAPVTPTVEPPKVPAPVEPPRAFAILGTSGDVAPSGAAVSWSAAVGAATYTIKIATTASCASPVDSQSELVALQYTPQVTVDGTYFICLTAVNAGGSTVADNSGTFTFARLSPPGELSITSASGVTAQTVAAVVWSASERAEKYAVKVGATADCASPVSSAENLTVTTFTPTISADGTYYVCVTALNAVGSRPATNAGQVTFTRDTTGPAPLQSFAAGAIHSLGALKMTWQAAASYADYDHMTIRVGAAGTAPADCASGTIFTTYNSFCGIL